LHRKKEIICPYNAYYFVLTSVCPVQFKFTERVVEREVGCLGQKSSRQKIHGFVNGYFGIIADEMTYSTAKNKKFLVIHLPSGRSVSSNLSFSRAKATVYALNHI